jgi:hypothetical protein
MSESKENSYNKRHMNWLKEVCPQTYSSLQITDGDSEDLKSCCQRLEQESYDLQLHLAETRELLRKCKDTIQASTVEQGISDVRKIYREELYKHIKEQLKEQQK